MRNNSKIFTGRAVQRRGGGRFKSKGKGKVALSLEEGEEKGYLLIQDLWTQGTDSIYDMCVVNNDAVSYQSKTPEKDLESTER